MSPSQGHIQRLDTQPNTIRREPEEVVAPANRKNTAQAAAAHQLSIMTCETLLEPVQHTMESSGNAFYHFRGQKSQDQRAE